MLHCAKQGILFWDCRLCYALTSKTFCDYCVELPCCSNDSATYMFVIGIAAKYEKSNLIDLVRHFDTTEQFRNVFLSQVKLLGESFFSAPPCICIKRWLYVYQMICLRIEGDNIKFSFVPSF